jgi:hypothetical protein
VTGKPDGIAETAWLTERIAGWVCTWAEHLRKRDEKDFAAEIGDEIGDSHLFNCSRAVLRK